MAVGYFENIGKKLSDTGQGVINKGKNMAEVTKINASISDEEKKLKSYYVELGKLYFSLHEYDYEEEFADIMTAVKNSQSRISELKEKSQEIRKVLRCEQCGAEIPSEALFCNVCGAKVERKTVVSDNDKVQCSKCGNFVNKNLNFCTSCGNPMR